MFERVSQMIEFFMPMIPPTVTHQEKKVHVVYDKKRKKHVPVFYEPDDVGKAREKFMAHLAKHIPKKKLKAPIQMVVKWCFPVNGNHLNGEYKTTKPDLDNSNKLLQDCLTDLGFWQDDCHVASLVAEKFWADVPGIYICIKEL